MAFVRGLPGGEQIGAGLERDFFQFLVRRQRRQRGKISRNLERRRWIAPQRVQPRSRQIGVVVEANHVLSQRRQRHLRLQHVLLRRLADGVLDTRRFNRLPRNFHVPVVNP